MIGSSYETVNNCKYKGTPKGLDVVYVEHLDV